MELKDLKEIAINSDVAIFEHILNNPSDKEDILSYLRKKDINKYYSVQNNIDAHKSDSKGVAALKLEVIKEVSKNSFSEVDVSLLVESPYQPRMHIDAESIEELSQSIKKDGLQSPIKVSPIKDSNKYYIVYGHRRVEAHKKLGLDKIKCIIEEVDNSKLRRLSLVENLQREELSLIEKAISYKNALESEEFSSQLDLAESLGIRNTKISETLSLLKLDDKIIKDLSIHKEMKDVTTLSILNKIKPEEQYDFYLQLKSGEIDREMLRKHLKDGTTKRVSQCESRYRSNKLQLTFKTTLKNKDKQKKFAEFAKEETERLIQTLKDKEKELESN